MNILDRAALCEGKRNEWICDAIVVCNTEERYKELKAQPHAKHVGVTWSDDEHPENLGGLMIEPGDTFTFVIDDFDNLSHLAALMILVYVARDGTKVML